MTTTLRPRPEASAARPIRPDGHLSQTGSDWLPSCGDRAGPPWGSEGACAGDAPAACLPHARWGLPGSARSLNPCCRGGGQGGLEERVPRGEDAHGGHAQAASALSAGSERPEPSRAGGARVKFRNSGGRSRGRAGASSRSLLQPEHLALRLTPEPSQGRKALAAGSAAAAGGAREPAERPGGADGLNKKWGLKL
ncbi:uncharacterized protein LOC121491943 isoform X4 [Vulpes lagopus]|uniref:uncharacterized protein LOC121491943 isoform X4 n=1 Tax=Vulpes lagopus TaxID=494514 RepID=UPI001BC9A322|nr:uncharacterized protein LOC121491943 isoform X4 [Vulpes lagopus]